MASLVALIWFCCSLICDCKASLAVFNWSFKVWLALIASLRAFSTIFTCSLVSPVAWFNSFLARFNSPSNSKFLSLASFNPAEISVICPCKRDVDFCKPIFAFSKSLILVFWYKSSPIPKALSKVAFIAPFTAPLYPPVKNPFVVS